VYLCVCVWECLSLTIVTQSCQLCFALSHFRFLFASLHLTVCLGHIVVLLFELLAQLTMSFQTCLQYKRIRNELCSWYSTNATGCHKQQLRTQIIDAKVAFHRRFTFSKPATLFIWCVCVEKNLCKLNHFLKTQRS